MSRFWIRLCKLLAAAALVFLLGLVIWTFLRAARNAASPAADNASPAPAGATATPIPTTAPPVTATPAPTATPVPTPSPTPEPVRYVISLVGDCTLASYPDIRGWGVSFESVVGTDWDYPFSGTRELFLHDDLTVANLECSISDLTAWAPTTFSFLAPSEAVEILTRGGVDAATMANNHAMDFGQAVYDDTAANLDRAGIAHTGDDEGILLVTPSGLTVGLYGTYAYHNPDPDTVAAGVRELRERGAEIVVVCAHWGNEASYYKNDNQVQCARAAIDAGASIVVGHGPHRLQTAETYNGGVIFYSLGNFVFGGNTAPGDLDSAVAQVVIERATDGSLSVSGTRIYPCSISSRADGNDYRPTLYEPGTEEYDRAMSKIDGSWTGENQVIDYSFMHKE